MNRALLARVIESTLAIDHGTYENWIANIIGRTLAEAANVARNFRRWGDNRNPEQADQIADAILSLKDKEPEE